MQPDEARPTEILLVEDSPSDTALIAEALREGPIRHHLSTVEDGQKAVQFVRREGEYAGAPRPDLILLDWNLPCRNGSEVLTELKGDERLKIIPVVVLTTSRSEQDALCAYQLRANCYVTKPVDFDQLSNVVREIEAFWCSIVTLPFTRTRPFS